MLCDTTPRRASVTTNGLWRMAARAWHEPPADACSVVSAHPSHSRSIKIIIPDFPLFYMRFPVGHSSAPKKSYTETKKGLVKETNEKLHYHFVLKGTGLNNQQGLK